MFFFSSTLFGQEQTEDLFHFGISVNPKLTIPYVDNPELIESINTINYSLSADLFYKVSDRFELKSGLNFSPVRLSQKDFSLTFGCDIDSQANVDIRNSFTKENNVLLYLGIPLEGRLKFSNNIYWKVGGEFLNLVYDRSVITLVECGMNEREINGNVLKEFNKTIFKLRTGLGVETNFKKDKKMYFEPQLEYSLNGFLDQSQPSIGQDNQVKTLDIGLIVGLKF